MRRKPSRPIVSNRMMKVQDILDEETLSAYRTQAISDASHRCARTGAAIPSDLCVEENKEWVDENKK